MLVTEHGLTFARDDDAWRCAERPTLLMVCRDRYRMAGHEQEFPTPVAALAAAFESEEVPREPGAARPGRG